MWIQSYVYFSKLAELLDLYVGLCFLPNLESFEYCFKSLEWHFFVFLILSTNLVGATCFKIFLNKLEPPFDLFHILILYYSSWVIFIDLSSNSFSCLPVLFFSFNKVFVQAVLVLFIVLFGSKFLFCPILEKKMMCLCFYYVLLFFSCTCWMLIVSFSSP